MENVFGMRFYFENISKGMLSIALGTLSKMLGMSPTSGVDLFKSYMWIGRGLLWKVGNGSNVLVGIDRIIGHGESFTLSRFLMDYLE